MAQSPAVCGTKLHAYTNLEESGATSAVLSRLKLFNKWLQDQEKLEAALKVAEGQYKEQLRIQLRHLCDRANRLQNRYIKSAKN